MTDRSTLDPTLPDDLSALDDDALSALHDDLVATFDRERANSEPDLSVLETLAADVLTVRAEADSRGLALTVNDQPAVAATASPVRPVRPRLDDIARRSPKPKVTTTGRRPVSITAAGERGRQLDLLDVARDMHAAARMMNDSDRRRPVASIAVPYDVEPLSTDPVANLAAIDDLIGQPEAHALVASGGWCAPSEPLFEMFDLAPDQEGGLLDLPSLPARAGAMIPTFYGIGDVSSALWTWTEAQDILAADLVTNPTAVKPCMTIPCPTWTECRMEAEGLCVTHGNLSDRAWPELTANFLATVFGAHAHRLSAAKIAKVLADAVVVAPGAGMLVSDAAGDLLGAIDLAAADIRSQHRIGSRRAIDVVLPSWVIGALRSNLAMRAGVDLLSMPTSRVTKYLVDRGVRPQFVADWQPLYNAAPATAWPANVSFLIFVSGSYIELDGGRIDLGVVRDSTLNATNDHTAAFSEQFFQICRRGPAARTYTVPLSVNGVTSCCPVV